MSRFFRAGSSESESEESEEDEIIPQNKKAPAPSRAFQFSDDEDDSKRVMRSAKDKRFEVLLTAIKQMRNSMKINDIARVLSEYENLTKGFEKAKHVVDKEGIPNFYIKILVELEDYVQTQWEDTDGRKKLSKLNAKALASLRQKHKKYNRDFEANIVDCRANPDKYEEEEEVEDEDTKEKEDLADSDDDFVPAAKVKKPAKDDDDSDSDFWHDDSDDDSDDSDDDEGGAGGGGGGFVLTAAYFLKKDPSDAKTKKEKREKKKVPRPEKQTETTDEWTEVRAGGTTKSRITFPKDAEINHQLIMKKFHEILAVRGKKGTDRSEQIDYFAELKKISDEHNLGVGLSLKLLFNIASAISDSAVATDMALKTELWVKLLERVQEIFTIIKDNPELDCGQTVVEENVEDVSRPFAVADDPVVLLERVDAEFTKILQNCDGHSTDYISVLRDEVKVVSLVDQLLGHFKKYDKPSELICRIYLLRIEHMYYKLDLKDLRSITNQIKVQETEALETTEEKQVEAVPAEKTSVEETSAETVTEETVTEEAAEESAAPSTGEEADDAAVEQSKSEQAEEKQERDDTVLLDKLCKYIYKHGEDRVRTRAMLCQIYHHALHDRWYQARDLMLISHLQEAIQHSDIPTQILYNRTMTQVGLCAFRHGLIEDAHQALHDIQATGRAKEMLAQGLMNLKNQERTPEQEKIEKRRMMPFHMHINLELLECVYLTSAMLLEVPFMASHEFDYRRRVISKSFHYQLRVSDRQALIGPPESMREHVVAASKAMMTGDWQKCDQYVQAITSWALFPNAGSVKEMITKKIKEESLRTYLFTYNKVYDSISMHSLASMFELAASGVHSTVSKMIINEELMASWDEPTQTLVLHHGAEPSYLQSLNLQLSDKINTLVEHHERILNFKYGRDMLRGGPQGEGGGRGGGEGGRGRGRGRGGYRGRGGGDNYRGRGGGDGYRGRGGGGYRGRGGGDSGGYRGRGGGDSGGYRGRGGGGGGYRGRGNSGGYSGGGGGGGYSGGGGGYNSNYSGGGNRW